MRDKALLISIPHSGTKIPPEAGWLKGLEPSILNTDTDSFVDDLYAPALKRRVLFAVVFPWNRYVVDMNRFPWDISPQTVQRAEELFKTLYKKELFQKGKQRLKSLSDIHWHKTTQGQILIKQPISQKTHKVLIAKYFQAYHRQIQSQIALFKNQGHKKIYLMDMHSMPSKALAYHRDRGQLRTEVVLGDHWGQSCSKEFCQLVVKAYQQAGFKVALNWPYKGGAISYFYGQGSKGQEAIQVEINRKLYRDEKTKKKNKNYTNIQLKLAIALAYIHDRLPINGEG